MRQLSNASRKKAKASCNEHTVLVFSCELRAGNTSDGNGLADKMGEREREESQIVFHSSYCN